MVDVIVGESRDGTGAADHDQAYVFGRPREYLTLVQQGWLTILRGYCMDARRGSEPRNCATGDMALTDRSDGSLGAGSR